MRRTSSWQLRVLPFLLAIAFATCPGASARANGPEIGIDAGHAVPVASTAVSLDSEWVRIDLPLDVGTAGDSTFGSMHCVYHLHNPLSRAVVVRMAFVTPSPWLPPDAHLGAPPAASRPSVHVAEGSPWVAPGSPMSEWLTTRAVPVRVRPVNAAAWDGLVAGAPDSLPTWTLRLPARGEVALFIDSRVQWSVGSDGESSGRMLTYCTRPARLWKGPIHEATIEFRIGEVGAYLLRRAPADSEWTRRIAPAGWEWTNEGILWRFHDWEPDADCVLSINFPLLVKGY